MSTPRSGQPAHFDLPDASRWAARTFDGFHRADGQVGTRNYWLVLPMVFCENRNVERMREALEEELGYGGEGNRYRHRVRELVESRAAGNGQTGSNGHGVAEALAAARTERVFPNLDGIRFLTHQGGCGGTRAGCAGSVRAARRLHPSPQRRRSDGAEPRLPERAVGHSDGRARASAIRRFSKPVWSFDQQTLGASRR